MLFCFVQYCWLKWHRVLAHLISYDNYYYCRYYIYDFWWMFQFLHLSLGVTELSTFLIWIFIHHVSLNKICSACEAEKKKRKWLWFFFIRKVFDLTFCGIYDFSGKYEVDRSFYRRYEFSKNAHFEIPLLWNLNTSKVNSNLLQIRMLSLLKTKI